jgi:hypothetical protein
MAKLTRAQILDAVDLPIVAVKVPEWAMNGTDEVCVRGMTVGERDLLIRVWGGEAVLDDERSARIASICIVDEQGNRVFTDEDIAALKRKSHTAMDRVLSVALDLSGMRPKPAEDIRKN